MLGCDVVGGIEPDGVTQAFLSPPVGERKDEGEE